MSARHLVLLATGRGKAEAVHQLVEGPVSAMWPGDDPAAPPARHGAGRRRRREPPAAGRLLPRDVRGEAGLAGPLSPSGEPVEQRVHPEQDADADHGEGGQHPRGEDVGAHVAASHPLRVRPGRAHQVGRRPAPAPARCRRRASPTSRSGTDGRRRPASGTVTTVVVSSTRAPRPLRGVATTTTGRGDRGRASGPGRCSPSTRTVSTHAHEHHGQPEQPADGDDEVGTVVDDARQDDAPARRSRPAPDRSSGGRRAGAGPACGASLAVEARGVRRRGHRRPSGRRGRCPRRTRRPPPGSRRSARRGRRASAGRGRARRASPGRSSGPWPTCRSSGRPPGGGQTVGRRRRRRRRRRVR